ncbi:MFS transporter [Sulfuracidifex metallicus DSM 6482 = JCM 9184]|uniref:MFS transporter n=1 Tax=Sulfuracidifex metallicus DSM 6482 = JCM 9184 TaxID=523847 RepID=A0A6A9QJ55_SULME|nr:MFS transporter [Sulfuracidifex metallicus]MUN28260.1 MFS transporter [Sulfuracidifex metallicus DSM 6482 = JCM 9184]WOE51210.1 MFS transporter [Sulfuracidifex metallicus DSM 6482 = JCM 9184]
MLVFTKFVFDEIDNRGISKFQVKSVLVGGAGVLADGYNLYSVSITAFLIQKYLNLSSIELGAVIAGTYYGAVIGSLLLGFLSDKLGRKALYGIDVTLMTIGEISQFFVGNFDQLFLTRALIGLGVGADYVLSPVIVSENSNAKDRGKLMVITFAFMWGIGAVLSAFSYQVLSYLGINGSILWRLVLSLGAIPTAAVIVFRRKITETVRFASRVRSDPRELERIKSETGFKVETMVDRNPSSFWFKRSLVVIIFSSLLWLLYDMYSSTFSLYGPITIASNLGLTPVEFVYAAQFIAGIPGQIVCIFLIDKIGRRKMITIGYAGVALWLGMYAILLTRPSVFGISNISKTLVGEAALLGFTFYLLNYFSSALGPASVIGSAMITPELVPTKIRGRAQSISVAVDRLASALSITSFPLLLSSFGLGVLVGVYSTIALVSSIIALKLIPEAKGRSLEEVSGEESIKREQEHVS